MSEEACRAFLRAPVRPARAATRATSGQVLTFGGGLASAVYSANGGGTSATPEEGFGTPNAGYPYLRAAPYPTRDPTPWSVTVALRDLAARFGYRGQVSAVRASAVGPSGRVTEVTLDGSSGPATVRGVDFDRALDLRSTLFTVRTEMAQAPPPPPPGGGPVQALPATAAPGPALPPAATVVGEAGAGRLLHLPLKVVAALLAMAVGAAAAFAGASGPAMALPRRRR